MKVLAFNSSPRMDNGNTHLILTPFLDGMRDAGAEVECHFTKKLTIKPCLGDLNCMFQTPKTCIQKDDFNTLFPKIQDADVLVLATPLYVFGVSGTMKNLLDRLVVQMSNPRFTIRNGMAFHPPLNEKKSHTIVLISTCGIWEVERFEPILVQMRTTVECLGGFKFAGALLRPHAEVMKIMMHDGVLLDDIFGAAKQAGRELVQKGEMDPDTLATVSREIMPLDDFVNMVNGYIDQILGPTETEK